jgi:hypothetical protein
VNGKSNPNSRGWLWVWVKRKFSIQLAWEIRGVHNSTAHQGLALLAQVGQEVKATAKVVALMAAHQWEIEELRVKNWSLHHQS